MKKSLILLTTLILALLLTACGGSEEPVTGAVEPAATQPPVVTEAETLPPETTAPAENDLSLGRMEGGVYTNAYVGYTCALDTDWTFLSAAELEQIPSTVSDMLSGSELAQQLEGVQQFTDMMAENVNDLTTMNVLYQKLSMQERIAYAAMTEEQIIESVMLQIDMIRAAYEQAGMTVISMEPTTVTFLGEERHAVRGEFTVQDVPYFTLQIFDYHLGEYSVTTTLASYIEDKTDSLLPLFAPVE